MTNTIEQVTHSQCTGCGACLNKCPVDAIYMKSDDKGFLFPEINHEKCINCGLCSKVCPALEPKSENMAEPPCYAVMAEDSIREKSSSGGVFTLLANWMFSEGGVVAGAAYTEDFYGVEHIIATNEEELSRIRGSKYVQSNTGLIYKQVKEYLDKGTPVLFTGTPCQISAVNKFLGKPYENLYTLDLVCHGVPSPDVYTRFIKEQEEIYGSKAVRVSFRDKDIVKWDVSTAIDFENGQKYRKKRSECAYMKSFLKLLTIRENCGNCPFASLPRQGDMTIADFWDIHRFNPKFDDRKGTSLVLPNNDKGKKLLEVLRQSSILLEEAPLEHGIKYNSQIKYSSILNPRRERFFELLKNPNYSFEKAVDYGLNRRFDIGYVGWWYGANYGSAMTNFALNRVLTDMGKTVLMLEWPVTQGEPRKGKPNTKTRRFANNFYEQSMFYKLDDYGRFNYHCESFVVGSDQLWNWWSNRDVGSYHFFLDFADDDHKKIAYSTSFGHDNAYYPEEMRLKVGYLLQRFDAVSVREKGGVAVCKKDYDVDAVQTVDPVFLCSKEAYDEAIALSEVKLPDTPYVLAYILNPTEEKMESVRAVAKEMKLPYYVILDGQDDFAKLKEQANDPNVLENVEIADWLKYFKNAEYVYTDSFHGFCYSVIFNRNMTVFPNKLRGLSRFESLSEMTGLEDRLVYSKEELLDKEPWKTPVDFDQVAERMKPLIDFSRNWLVDALNRPKRSPSTKELQLKELLTAKENLAKQAEETQRISNRIDEFRFRSLVRKVYRKLRSLVARVLNKLKQIFNYVKWKLFHKA